MRAKGALWVPRATALRGLIKSFCQFVYCRAPVVDLYELLELSGPGDVETPETSISLLLLNAIMLTASMHAPVEVLRDAGYSSRAEALAGFHDKVRVHKSLPCADRNLLVKLTLSQVLYNLNYEKDAVATLQTLILLAYASDDSESDKDKTHWTTVAVSLCYRIGLNHYPKGEGSALLGKGPGRLWRRLWWSCFILDRLVTVTYGRIPGINQQDWDVPYLQMDDLELEAMRGFVDQMSVQQLAECFIEKAELSVHRGCECSTELPPATLPPYHSHYLADQDYELGLIHSMFGPISKF